MQRKSFGKMKCPIARVLERVGEWWSILILRDALNGHTRFDEFEKNLGIAPNMLTRRLDSLVKAGVLERRRYSERPPRHEYVLTDIGRDFRPIIVAMYAWGNKYFAPEGASVLLVDAETGAVADPVMVDRNSGRPLVEPDYRFTAGPAARKHGVRKTAAGKTVGSKAGERKIATGADGVPTDSAQRPRSGNRRGTRKPASR